MNHLPCPHVHPPTEQAGSNFQPSSTLTKTELQSRVLNISTLLVLSKPCSTFSITALASILTDIELLSFIACRHWNYLYLNQWRCVYCKLSHAVGKEISSTSHTHRGTHTCSIYCTFSLCWRMQDTTAVMQSRICRISGKNWLIKCPMFFNTTSRPLKRLCWRPRGRTLAKSNSDILRSTAVWQGPVTKGQSLT